MNLCRSPPRRDVAHELDRPGPRNGRIDRGESTRLALMRAAENLIAERGIENVAVAHIVREAGQNNVSALQCHFDRLQGIVEARRAVRGAEIKAKRAASTGELMARDAVPDRRDFCRLMIAPTFELARTDPGFRKATRAFGRMRHDSLSVVCLDFI